jgi:hypothetical protein
MKTKKYIGFGKDSFRVSHAMFVSARHNSVCVKDEDHSIVLQTALSNRKLGPIQLFIPKDKKVISKLIKALEEMMENES